MNENKGLLTRLGETIDQYHAERRRNLPQDTRPQPGRLGRLLRWLTPNGGTLLLVALLILTTNVWAKPLLSPSNAPGPSAYTVNYQGRLADSSGSPLSGTYGMTFALWDAATGGNLVWGPESHAAVPVSDGLFSVGLGSQTSGGIPTTVWDGDRYLEVTVGGETLSPRELIRSVPIAGMALTVPDGAITSAKLSRRMSKAVLTSNVPMPNRSTWYDILSLTINLDRETLVTVYALAAPYNLTDAFFRTAVFIDESQVAASDNWSKGGIGEGSMVSTSVRLGSGQHQIKLCTYSWSDNGTVASDSNRTQLTVIEG